MRRSDSPQPRLDREPPPHPLGSYRPGPGGRPRKPGRPRSYRGGYTTIDPGGYIREYSPDHPKADALKTMAQHRLVMEGVLGRLLEPTEIVHHKNRNRADNRAANLELHDRKSHWLEHVHDHSNKIELTEDQVRTALRGRTTDQAAALLGLHPQTLRNRFGHLLTRRRSPGAALPEPTADLVRSMAADPKISQTQAAARLSVSVATLKNWCSALEVTWQQAPGGRPSRSASAVDVSH